MITSTLSVSGVEAYLWDVFVDTSITHTWNADLQIALTSPAGTIVTLTSNNGSSNDNVFNGTHWNDRADPDGLPPYVTNDGLATDHAYVNLVTATPLVAEEALSAFRGEDPNGDWVMTIADTADQDGGSLDSWFLTLVALKAAPEEATTVFDSTDTPIDISPEGTPVITSTLSVSGLLDFLGDVDVHTEITHTWNADLQIAVTSPVGTVATLTSNNGGSNDNVFNGTTWDDDAGDINPPGPVTDNVFENLVVETPLVPEEALGAFVGEDPNGNWVMTIADTAAEDGGSLASWSLELTTARCPTGELEPEALEVDAVPVTSDGNGVFEAGEQVEVAPAWRNGDSIAHTATGSASNFDGPGGPVYNLLDDAAAYGTVASGDVASCQDSGDCYAMEIDGARPATHWDAAFDEALSTGSGWTWALHVGDSFTDVPRTSVFYRFIETLLHHSVSAEPALAMRDLRVVGCTETEYCPADPTAREQVAVLLLKALEGSSYEPPACMDGGELFTDVPFDSPFCPWIEDLAGRGVTAGCGGGNYCADDSVTRAQAAVFLLKTLEGSQYVPPACSGVFADVPCPSLFANWVEDLAGRGITAGCGGGNYCPAGPVTRDQIAVFLTKTFGLLLYGP
ncbi:MAG: proprotein convertase P-domain-containing protein [Thermoanaerobaculia bacterium]